MNYPSEASPSELEIITLPLGPLETNCYIVYHPEYRTALIIDPADDAELILAELHQMELTPAAVVITHGHADHIAAVPELAQAGIPIMIHAADAEKLSDPVRSGATMLGFSFVPSQATELLEEDETIDLWDGRAVLRVMHTPGHSIGSICLVGDKVAFVGDLLFAGSIGRTDILGGDEDAMADSLEEIAQLPDDTVIYPGHGPATTIRIERGSNPFLS